MKIMRLVALAALVFGAASCGDEEDNRFPGYEKHESGIYFKTHKSGKSTIVPTDSALLVMEIAYVTESDSVFQPYMGEPTMIVVKEARYQGDFIAAARTMKIGDSTTFMIRVDSLLKYTKGMRLPDFLDSSGYIGYVVKLDTIISAAEFKKEMKRRGEEARVQDDLKNNDAANLAKFLADNKYTAKPSATGVYYIEKTAGKGALIKTGQSVIVHYKGYFTNNVVFDESKKQPNSPPVTFKLGDPQLGVIPGLEEGLIKMKKGGTATIIVPADQAYRDGLTRAFDIEIVDVK